MAGISILKNEYIELLVNPDGIYVKTLRKGFTLDKLNEFLARHPEIEITSFKALKSALDNAPSAPEKVGIIKERIVIETNEHDLKATVVYNLPKEELDLENRENLIKQTAAKLKEKGITYGILKGLFYSEIISGKQYTIAEGIPPIHGTDSIITMYELKESKPDIREDGKADFYELKLINRVKAGEWLGERTDATEGTPGRSVKGAPIKPFKGRNYPLNYDRNSVVEIKINNKTTLYSKFNGAVNYDDGKISVSNHIEIEGDVNYSTGNIDFDGYVTVKGSVADGFSVTATKDIEINGDLGLGNVKGITSTNGSIFVKGGIISKGQVEIIAARDIITKFVDNAILQCNGTVRIGFYCINSTVKAKEVILDSTKGTIIGGNIKAEIRVSAPLIGSDVEKKTVVEVTGFNRQSLMKELEDIYEKVKELKDTQTKLKLQFSALNELDELNQFQEKDLNNIIDKSIQIKEEIKKFEELRKNYVSYLKVRGEGEISISKKAYPKTTLIINKNVIEITAKTLATTYYFQDGLIKQIN